MRIAIDIRSVGPGMDGVGYYTAQLVRALAQVATGHEIFLITAQPRSIVPADAPVPVHQIVTPVRLGQTRDEQLHLPAIAKQYDIDVFHGPGFMCPVANPCKTVVTVHDLIYMIYPQFYEADFRTHMNQWVAASVAAADHVIAVSECTKRDLETRLHASAQKITVTPEAAGEEFRPVDGAETASVRARYRLTGEYVLAVGLAQPRKNITALLHVFKELLVNGLTGWQLVVVGGYPVASCVIPQLVRDLGLSEHVVIAGYVPRDDLPRLYSGAGLFVFPSLYEGFGLPVLEAMACGAPVICSNTSSLPEVAGDSALTVDPTDPSSIREAVSKCIGDPGLREALRAKGLVRAKQFTWRRAAEQTLRVYESLVDTLREPCTLPQAMAALRTVPANSASHIGIVAPWDTECGIAEYSRFLRNALRGIGCEAAVLAEQSPAAKPEQGVLPCWSRGRSLEGLVQTVSRERINVVHVQFHEAFFFRVRHYQDFVQAMAKMGVRVVLTVHELHDRSDTEYFRGPVHLIVHNRDCFSWLRARGVSCPIEVIPHGIVTPVPNEQTTGGSPPGERAPSTGPLLMSCGFVFPKKGYERVIMALPELVESYPDLRYQIVGSTGEPGSLSARYREMLAGMAQELGVETYVCFQEEYADLPPLQAALSRADAAVFPYADSTQGASGAVQIALGAGATVVASDAPFFADLGSAVLRFRTDEELVQAIRTALEPGDARVAVLRQAQALVAERCWPKVAQQHAALYAQLGRRHENRR